jgi:hypothetical protein
MTEQDIETSTDAADGANDAPDLTPDVVPTVGNLLPNGLPLLPAGGPDLAGPNDPVEE